MHPSSTTDWSIYSWQSKHTRHQPEYQNSELFHSCLRELESYPPLVSVTEVIQLKQKISQAALGRAFILQGGDCAERFVDCKEDLILNKIKILLQMSMVLGVGLHKPIIKIGRIAGQYGKPRSNPTEELDGKTVSVFLGDNVNSFEADPLKRIPDPTRLLKGYHHSAMTLNYLRSLQSSGILGISSAAHWKEGLKLLKVSPFRERYQSLRTQVDEILHEFDSHIPLQLLSAEEQVYTSHEGLILALESALTKKCGISHYNLSAHMLWIGDRTKDLDGGHVEYFRGISNPVGIKVGPSSDPFKIIEIIKQLNPFFEPGKILLITRFGADKVSTYLPNLIRSITQHVKNICWLCDPMHGNMIFTKDGIKTRSFDSILSELEQTIEIHKLENSILGGVHFEMCPDPVTECIGGPGNLRDYHLSENYKSYCDPRLNYIQSLEMAFLITSLG